MKIGIIGGSGLYKAEGIGELKEHVIDTPFGAPSAPYFLKESNSHTFYFLPRHGIHHSILPSEINYRANIYGFKMQGVEQIISISAVGSLQEQYRPRDILLVDQYMDRTKNSKQHSFSGEGLVAHVAFAEPVCSSLRELLNSILNEIQQSDPAFADIRIHNGGTYVNMEGPHFSTRAESQFYHASGFDVIGMTTLAEAKLAREAEMCYACISFITDYDSWRAEEESVNVDMVIQTLKANVGFANRIIQHIVANPPKTPADCACHQALKYAVMSDAAYLPPKTREKLKPIIGNLL